MTRRLAGLGGLALITLLGLAGCDDATSPHVHTGEATISFDNVIDGAAVHLDHLVYSNPRGTVYEITMLRYAVSDIVLHGTDGRTFGMDGIHYRDEGKPATRNVTLEEVPNGSYDMVSFTFGLDETKNVKDAYLNHPNDFHSDMAWPSAMGGDKGIGYHYMRLEGNFEETPQGAKTGYATHTGARWLSTDPLPYHHFFRVYVPFAAKTIEGDHLEVSIQMDVDGWYRDHTPSPGDDYDSDYDWHDLDGEPMGQMIMSNLEAQQKLMLNGPHCFAADAEVHDHDH